jgi:radical SAM superfamily enzyme YgiQ (UPF0313 family)
MHYNGPVVRPYTDADSLIVEVTVGCTHNSCTFCNFYKGYQFSPAPLSQIESDLKEAAAYSKKIRNIWASGGNPYALSTGKLLQIGRLMRKYFPEARISTYARVDDLCRKSAEEMRELRKAGFEDLVIGIESGYDPVLKHVNKGYSAQDILTGCKRLEEAGVDYRIIYLGGLAGSGKGEEAALASAKLINRLHPYYMFLTTVAVLPETELYREMQEGSFTEATERERFQEFRTLIGNMENPIVIDSRSVANMIPFVANLPADKEKTLEMLDQVIESMSEENEQTLHRRRSMLHSV